MALTRTLDAEDRGYLLGDSRNAYRRTEPLRILRASGHTLAPVILDGYTRFLIFRLSAWVLHDNLST